MFDLGKFGAEIELDSSNFNKGMKDAENKTGSFKSKLGSFAKTAGKVALGAVVGLAAAVTGAFAATKKVAGNLDEIGISATKMGVGTDYLQEMHYWAEQNGVSSGQMEKALGRLNQRMGRAADGNEKYADALTNLGVDMDGVRDGTVTTEDAMATSIKTLSEMSSESEKSAAASELFGTKMARDLMPALQDGSMSIEEAKEKAQELGLVIGEDSIDAATKFQNTWDELTGMMQSFGTKIIAKLMPTFQHMMDWVIDHMPQIQAIFDTTFDAIGTAITFVADFIRDQVVPALQSLWDWIEPHLPMIQEGFELAFGLAKEILEELILVVQEVTEWFAEHWAILEPILIGVAAGVAVWAAWTGAIALWSATTAIATGIGAAFAAVIAFITSPIGLVVIAIGLLVAAGVALYKNWDVIKEKAIEIWGAITEFFVATFEKIVELFHNTLDWIDEKTNGKFKLVTDTIRKFMTMAWDIIKQIWDGIKESFRNTLKIVKALVKGDFSEAKRIMQEQMENAKQLLSEIWNKIKTFIAETLGRILGSVAAKFQEIKNKITNKLQEARDALIKKFVGMVSSAKTKGQEIVNAVKDKFDSAKKKITEPIEKAKDTVSRIIDDIKGFFDNLKLKIPKPEMPSMPSFSLKTSSKSVFGKTISYPSGLGVNWNADGGIFTKPTIFNTANAGMQGVGEAGAEAIIPLRSSVLADIGKGVASNMSESGNSQSDSLLQEQNKLLRQLVKKDNNMYMDGEILTKSISNRQAMDYDMANYMAGNR